LAERKKQRAVKWVIAYDIHANKGRRRVAKRLEQVGFRRQKSVFESFMIVPGC
jgi:CRISPR-associated endonuclease Cas2